MIRLLSLLLIATPTSVEPIRGVVFQGEAHSIDGSRLLYEEHHYVRTEGDTPLERIVLYRCPNGESFARKTIHYGEPRHAPQFRMDDVRFDYVEGFERGHVSAEAFVQRPGDDALRRQAVAAGESLVVDAGFDEFIRANWQALQEGKPVPLRFLVPSRLAAYGFKLRKVGDDTLYGEPVSIYRLALSGVFGWFVDAIDVYYSDRERRLLRFVGLTNVRETAQSNLTARVDFPPERDGGELDAGTWEQARREPLVACQVGG